MKHLSFVLVQLLSICLLVGGALAQPTSGCSPSFTSGCSDYDGLNGFVFNGLELSRKTGCGYNATYVSPVANVSAGQTYSFSGTLLSQSYQEYVAIWIDLNRNGTFETGERLFLTPSTVTGSFSGNLTIPANTTSGALLMRIIVRYNQIPTDPCGAYTYGEMEHYTLNIPNGSCVAPTGLLTPAATVAAGDYYPSSIVSWNTVSGANGYELSWGTTTGGVSYPNTTTVTTPSYRIQYLDYDKPVTVQVRSRCASGGTSAYTTSILSTPSSCAVRTPTSLTAFNITSSSASISWTSSYSFFESGFEARYRVRNSNSAWTVVSGTSYYAGGYYAYGLNLTSLASGTQYEWQARNTCGLDNADFTAWSASAYFTTTGGVCPAPTGLVATPPVASTATAYPPFSFSWNAVAGASSYNVQIINNTTGGTAETTGYPFTSYEYSAPSNTTLTIQIQSQCSSGGVSTYSSITYVTPGSCATLPPYSLTTTGIANASATLNWTSQTIYLGGTYDPQYELQWRVRNSTTWTTIASTTATTTPVYSPYPLTGLQPGTAYEWQVRSKCIDGSTSSYTGPVSFTTTGGVCTAPTTVTTQNITQSSAQINWSAVANATNYNLVVQSQGTFPNSFTLTNLSGTTYLLDALSFNTPYRVQVVSRCASGALSAPASVTFSTLSQCSTLLPENLTYHVTGISSLSLSWSVPYLTAGFDLRWQVQGATTWNLVSGLTSPSYTLTGLSGSTNYNIEVRSRCSDGGLSAWVPYPTLGTEIACTASNPISLTTTGITSSSALLLWQIPYVPTSNFATKYNIRWTVPGFPSRTTLFDVPVTYAQVNGVFYTAFSLTGLSGNTVYEWEVQAVCALGDASNWAGPVSFTTPPNVCPYKPDIATTSTIAATSAVIASGIQSYAGSPSGLTTQYQWRVKNPSAAWIDIAPSGGFGGVFVSASLTGLTPNTAYEWQVRIRCSDGGLSDWKGPVSFTTLSPTCAGPVSVFVGTPVASTASNGSTLQAPVSWSPVSGVSTYEVRWFSAANPSFVQSTSGLTGSPYTLTGLNYGTIYTVQLRGLCSSGLSSSFVSTTFSTPSVCPFLAPTSLTTTGIASSSALLDWNFGYFAGGSYPSGFELQWRIKNTTNWNTVTNLSLVQSEYSLTGLTGGTAYEWQVRSRCGQSEYTNWVGPVSFTTVSTCPTPPGLSVTVVGTSTAVLSWSPVAEAILYNIEWEAGSLSSGAVWGSVGSYTLTGLSVNRTYIVRVQSQCDNNQFSVPASTTFTTQPIGSTSTAGCSTSNVSVWMYYIEGSTTFDVSWITSQHVAPAIPVGYEFEWKQRGSQFTSWSLVSVSAISRTNPDERVGWTFLRNLNPSTNYEFRFRMQCSNGGVSNYLVWNYFTTRPPCPNAVTVKNGNWSDSSVWSCGFVPTVAEPVTINHAITIPPNLTATALRVTYGAGGKLIYNLGSQLQLGF